MIDRRSCDRLREPSASESFPGAGIESLCPTTSFSSPRCTNHTESAPVCATSDFAASASTHRCAYVHSCRQDACASSACGVVAPVAIECVRPAAVRNPPGARAGASGVEGLPPPAQSTHQTFFVDGDQCAFSPTSSLSAHEWQRPPYFSEMKRRSSGSFVNGWWSERSETRERKPERVGKPADIFAILHLVSQAHRLSPRQPCLHGFSQSGP